MIRPFALAIAVVSVGCTGVVGDLFEGGAGGDVPAPRIRRLSRVEIDNTLSVVLGKPVTIATQLATEDSVMGYTTHEGLTVSTLFADQLDTATAALAKTAAATPTTLLNCNAGEAEGDCVKRFIAKFGGAAWRRPLSADEAAELMSLYQTARDAQDSQADSLALLVQATLEAVGFLYRTELGEGGTSVKLTPYEIASELSYLLTAAPPDAELLAAAEAGQLSSADGRAAQLQRLLSLPAAHVQMRTFVLQWLGMVNVGSFQKDNNVFPDFSTDFRASVLASTNAYIDAVLFNEQSSLKTLLSGDFAVVDSRLAQYMKLPDRPGTTPARVSMASLPRRGLLTQPGFLAVYAHNDEGAPVLRGKMVRTRLLCGEIPAPPPNVVPAVAPANGVQTTRERTALHATAACAGCHTLMDPIGFGFESFDGLGAYRTTEVGKPIDDSGEIIVAPDETVDVAGTFKGAVELVQKLSDSQQVGDCAVTHAWRFSWGRREGDADAPTITLAKQRFGASNQGLFGAFEGIVRSNAFVSRRGQP